MNIIYNMGTTWETTKREQKPPESCYWASVRLKNFRDEMRPAIVNGAFLVACFRTPGTNNKTSEKETRAGIIDPARKGSNKEGSYPFLAEEIKAVVCHVVGEVYHPDIIHPDIITEEKSLAIFKQPVPVGEPDSPIEIPTESEF